MLAGKGRPDFLFPSSLQSVSSVQPVFSQEVYQKIQDSIKDSTNKILNSQDIAVHSLRDFIEQQLQLLKASLSHEAHISQNGVSLTKGQDSGEIVDDLQLEGLPEPVKQHDQDGAPIGMPEEVPSQTSESTRPCMHPQLKTAASSQLCDIWEDLQEAVLDVDDHNNLYQAIVRNRVKAEGTSFWHNFFGMLGIDSLLQREQPTTFLAKITDHRIFVSCQTFLIVINTMILGYETDQSIKAALQTPRGKVAEWIAPANLIFNIIFLVELIFRMIALRSWFWVAPGEWYWNSFDVVVVGASLLTEIFLRSVNLSVFRTMRVLRAIRAARVFRVVRFFRDLRKMLFGIVASMMTLMWCLIFLAMTMFMFSIVFIQAVVEAIDAIDTDSKDMQDYKVEADQWYGSLGIAMFSLVAAVTGGVDWITCRKPLIRAGSMYTAAFLLYVLFVIVGVMNVLTGVFLASAEDYTDRSMVVQNEQVKTDLFVEQMLDIFNDMDVEHAGAITWTTFCEAMKSESLQSYLSAHQLEPTHARLMFDLLDENNEGQVSVYDFVMGMLRLKGEAKAIDARIIQRQVGMIPKLLNSAFKGGLAHHTGAL